MTKYCPPIGLRNTCFDDVSHCLYTYQPKMSRFLPLWSRAPSSVQKVLLLGAGMVMDSELMVQKKCSMSLKYWRSINFFLFFFATWTWWNLLKQFLEIRKSGLMDYRNNNKQKYCRVPPTQGLQVTVAWGRGWTAEASNLNHYIDYTSIINRHNYPLIISHTYALPIHKFNYQYTNLLGGSRQYVGFFIL